MTTRGRTAALCSALVLAGIVFGVFTSLANHAPGWVVLSKIIGVGWSWAAVGVAVAAVARRRQTLAVMVVLLAAVAGYYLADLTAGAYDTIDFSAPAVNTDPTHTAPVILWSAALSDFVLWASCAIFVSWPLARIGVATRRANVWGLAARIAVPLGAAVEMLALRLPGELAVQPSGITVFIYLLVAVLGVASTFALCTLHVRRTRSRVATSTTPLR